MELRIAGILKESVVDGPGIRMVIFAQGCPRHCEGCQNAHTIDTEGGELISFEELLNQIHANSFIKGVTFSGGEPFLQADFLAKLAREIRKKGLDVMTYTGYTWEQLTGSDRKDWRELLEQTEYLVDGPFILAERDISLAFRGSRNQRIIDVQKSLETGEVVLGPWA